MRHAVVIGGGIGGLAAAVGLHRTGWQVTVLEQSTEFAELGAGLTLWPNGQRALEALGFRAEVRAMAEPQRSGGVRAADGRWLLRLNAERFERDFGLPVVGVHRAQLHGMLLAAIPPEMLRAGIRVIDVRADGALPGLGLPPADLVVGADGIDSQLRARLWPNHPGPRYTGFTAWRATCRHPKHPEIATTWGHGKEVGIVPLVDGRTYWYATMRAPEGQRNEDEHAFLREHFGWHDPIPELIEQTRSDDLIRHDLRYLATPLASYRAGNIALVGDAAHAMEPNLGQGACQTLEDAAVLVAACARHPQVSDALDAYDAERRPRSQQIARASSLAGRFGPLLTNRVAVALRNAGVRCAPRGAATRAFARAARWHAPDIGLTPNSFR